MPRTRNSDSRFIKVSRVYKFTKEMYNWFLWNNGVAAPEDFIATSNSKPD